MSGRDTRVLMKLMVDGATDRVLGCHIVGDPTPPRSSRRSAIAVKMKATKADFDADHRAASDRGRRARDHAHADRAPRARSRSGIAGVLVML